MKVNWISQAFAQDLARLINKSVLAASSFILFACVCLPMLVLASERGLERLDLMAHGVGYFSLFSHLKWTPAIALGYAASIGCHIWVNAGLF